ncbi:MAG: glycosyl hydrolase, partial [Draconibacterium sp.]|nr:glycosyl hydrolase [Draconibacterium sp.]
YNERNFKSVYHGSPGADGPIMDHYKTEAVRAYLNRLKAIEEETGLPLSELIRALFCDSIELGGSNWTDDMKKQFMEHNGYDITPWLPFVIQPAQQPNQYETSAELAETIRRVQYDYYNTIIKVFLERFTQEFQDFCTENNVLCRYQAYGTPFYMGLFQGNMIPDIPESNNWIYSRGKNEAETSAYQWNRNHGYMLWNKAASSAAHINGKAITSSEAMTNTSGAFRTSLETIKQSDDINFITGINHTVLHGYNYSPPEAGFPGWMRYGAYFSEQNTWWEYFKKWADYNARLSSVFQNSTLEVDIAVLGRVRDYWGVEGLTRTFLNDKPWYYARLWEPISNLGSSCDYIHQPVIETATIDGNKLVCGKMQYSAVVLTEVLSLTSEAAKKLKTFAEAGGKIVFVGEKPNRSLSFKNAENNDAIVSEAVESVINSGHGIQMEAPEESADFIAWTKNLMEKIELQPQVVIDSPKSHLYCMKQVKGDQEIYFFANSDRKKAIEFEATFASGKKVPYIWIPETGERFILPYKEKNKLQIKLEALESALIVFEPSEIDLPYYEFASEIGGELDINPHWNVKFEHVNGTEFTREMKQLVDFKSSDDEALQTFAGTVFYNTQFENKGKIKFIKLSEVN